MVQDSTATTSVYGYLSDVSFWIKVYSVILSIIGAIKLSQNQILLWNTRKLRKIWGIKDKDHVIVICSELDEPIKRQNVEPREFIYNLKYGDIDAYVEVIVTLLRLYPKFKLRILSSGEAETTTFDMSQNIVLIGGPDYNEIASKILSNQGTQINYRSPYVSGQSKIHPNEIVIYHADTDREYCELDEMKDYGYFERINNPNDPKRKIILIGGCHTIGVTAAAKSFSLSKSEHGEIPGVVLSNSKRVAKRIARNDEFAVIVKAERVGQSINTPVVDNSLVFVRKQNNDK